MHGNKGNGTLEKWNIGKMGFLKNHASFHYSTIPLVRHHK